MLMNAYRGVGPMCNLLMEWTEDLGVPRDKVIAVASTALAEHFAERVDPALLDSSLLNVRRPTASCVSLAPRAWFCMQ
jgi:hypothetical protein